MRLRLVIIFVIVCAIIGFSANPRAVDSHDPIEKMVTRGPRIAPNTWLAGLEIERQREDAMTAVWLLQTPIKIDASLPLWSIIMAIGGGGMAAFGAFITMRSDLRNLLDKFVAHEKEDAKRHDELREDIQSLR